MKRCLALIVSGAFVLSACTPRYTNSQYERSEIGRAATVMHGTIISMRDVNLSGTSSGLGAGTGAVGGGVAGAVAAGNNVPAAVVGTVGGAVIGGVAGAMVEEGATKSKITEFVVQQENGQIIAVPQSNEDSLRVGDKILVLRSDVIRIIRDTSISTKN
jgi:outer membrane lipoprotein SlyB